MTKDRPPGNAVTERDPGAHPARVLERTYRRESGRLTAMLVRRLGTSRLDLAECALQDAAIDAMRSWPVDGIPDNPAAWLHLAARRRALDRLRQEAGHDRKTAEFLQTLAATGQEVSHPVGEALRLAGEVTDDRLRLLFIACHPALPAETHLPMALKTLFGLSNSEIAGLFLTQETAIAQRLVRARQKIAAAGLTFEMPDPEVLPVRRGAVLSTVYLAFTEGYNAHGGDVLVRADICREAIRLARELAGHAAGDDAEVDALLALMQLHASRLPARTDAAGDLLLLEHQDRRLWDQDLIRAGIASLERSMRGGQLSRYHLEAGIAACHALAPAFERTDWSMIISYYDDLLRLHPSPVASLGRAAAVGMRDGPAAGLGALRALKTDGRLARHHLLHAVEAELLARAGRPEAARKAWRQALTLGPNEVERRFIERRLAALPPP